MKTRDNYIPKQNHAQLKIDLQNGFINKETEHLVDSISSLQYNYAHVAATRFVNEKNSVYRQRFDWHECSIGSEAYHLSFEPVNHALIYDKNKYSGLCENLTAWLNKNKIDRIDLCGINTEVCVLLTAEGLMRTGHNIYLLSDYCASTRGIEYHKSGLLAACHIIGDQFVI